MGWFTPYKKANKFSYRPRFYDEAKEARDRRRAELRGETSADSNREYTPGQYIRTQSAARSARREERDRGRANRRMMGFVAALLLLLTFYLVYPRLVNVFSRALDSRPATMVIEEEFDPYAPIVIVPNDYDPDGRQD